MGLAFPASVECDKCGEKAVIQVALTKLKPRAVQKPIATDFRMIRRQTAA
jgi:hypothetical protein